MQSLECTSNHQVTLVVRSDDRTYQASRNDSQIGGIGTIGVVDVEGSGVG